MPCAAAAAGSSRWWLIVLWSVTARNSRPRLAANLASSGTVIAPSECTVCVCRSPASQRHAVLGAAARAGPACPAPRDCPLGQDRRVGNARRGGRELVADSCRRDHVQAENGVPGARLQARREGSREWPTSAAITK